MERKAYNLTHRLHGHNEKIASSNTNQRYILRDMFFLFFFFIKRGIKEMLEVQVYKENQELWYVSDKTVN